MAAKKKLKLKVKTPTNGNKFQQLQAIANECNKQLGVVGSVYLGKDQRPAVRVSTGIVSLDYVLGGGLVKGQLVQFTGGESCFKTTAALESVAKVQRDGGLAVWVVGEGFDGDWAAKRGVDLNTLVLVAANTGDTAIETAMTLLESNLVDIMVFDSYQSLGTTRESEGSVEDESYGGAGAPQMWGRVMRRTYAAMSNGCSACLIGISQVRAPIGKYGVTEPEGTGIWALKHWKAADIYFRKGEPIYEGDASEKRKLVRREFKLHCKKNKTAVSDRQASFWFERHDVVVSGKKKTKWKIDNVGSLMRLSIAYDVIERTGAWYQGFGIRTQGEEKFLNALKKDPIKQRKVRKALFEQLNG